MNFNGLIYVCGVGDEILKEENSPIGHQTSSLSKNKYVSPPPQKIFNPRAYEKYSTKVTPPPPPPPKILTYNAGRASFTNICTIENKYHHTHFFLVFSSSFSKIF